MNVFLSVFTAATMFAVLQSEVFGIDLNAIILAIVTGILSWLGKGRIDKLAAEANASNQDSQTVQNLFKTISDMNDKLESCNDERIADRQEFSRTVDEMAADIQRMSREIHDLKQRVKADSIEEKEKQEPPL